MDNYKQLYEKTNEEYKEFYPLTDILSIIDKESGKNLKQLLNQYNHIKLDWKGNIVDTRNSVPLILRHKGLFVTYDNGTSIITEFYKGEDISVSINSIWQNDNNWTDLSPGASLADNEDIAEIDGKFKFADRNYNPAQFTGMGRVILRKNLIDVGGGTVKNVLTQDMINKSNTIYEIRYDFDLNGEEITIPEDCILDFQGGSLNNGIIVGNNTFISAKQSCIFNNVKVSGTFKNNIAYSVWSDNIHNILNISNNIELTSDIEINSPIILQANKKVIGNGYKVTADINIPDQTILQLSNNCAIENLTITSNNLNSTTSSEMFPETYSYDKNLSGVALSNNCICNNVTVIGLYKGFISGEKNNLQLINCNSKNTGWGAVSFYHCKYVTIQKGSYKNCGEFGGVMLPSCHDFLIDNIYVYNPTSTGINPGGSSVVDYNTERGIVSNCIVEAGDCINFENGAIDCIIENNICRIHSLWSGAGTGVGVLSHDGGGNCKNININNNNIKNIYTDAGEAIVIGVIDTKNDDMYNINIVGNTVEGPRVALNLNKTVKSIYNANIVGNNFNANTSAIWVKGLINSKIANNILKCTTTTTISNYYGVYFMGIASKNLSITDNISIGFGSHYRQDVNCESCTFLNNKTVANEDDVTYTTISYKDDVTNKLTAPSYLSKSASGTLTANGKIPVIGNAGLIIIRGTVSWAPDSNESCSVWFYTNTKNGANMGYTTNGASVVKISSLKHDWSSAITDVSLTGSDTEDVINVSVGDFNVVQYSIIQLI